jgi:hypothetical protein
MNDHLLPLAFHIDELNLKNEIIGSTVCSGSHRKSITWIVDLLDDSPAVPRPHSSTTIEQVSKHGLQCADGWEDLLSDSSANAMTYHSLAISTEKAQKISSVRGRFAPHARD